MGSIGWLKVRCLTLVFFAAAAASATAQNTATSAQSRSAADPTEIRAAAERFLHALDDLDWERFRAMWASDATVFFPFADTPHRVAGTGDVEARWRRFFEEARARRAGPPYLQIEPRDLRVDRFGDVGLVTFVFDGLPELQGQLARRTLVLVLEGGAWKVVHLHASSLGRR